MWSYSSVGGDRRLTSIKKRWPLKARRVKEQQPQNEFRSPSVPWFRPLDAFTSGATAEQSSANRRRPIRWGRHEQKCCAIQSPQLPRIRAWRAVQCATLGRRAPPVPRCSPAAGGRADPEVSAARSDTPHSFPGRRSTEVGPRHRLQTNERQSTRREHVIPRRAATGGSTIGCLHMRGSKTREWKWLHCRSRWPKTRTCGSPLETVRRRVGQYEYDMATYHTATCYELCPTDSFQTNSLYSAIKTTWPIDLDQFIGGCMP